MLAQPIFVFTIREELTRVDAILSSACGLTQNSVQFRDARQYVIAKLIQNLFLTVAVDECTDPKELDRLDQIYSTVMSHYEASDNGFNYNFEQDVGSNKLFYRLSSDVLPETAKVIVDGYNVIISERR